MIRQYRFTDKELKELLKSMVILVDSREQVNNHILQYFDSKKIPYKIQKLDVADYSFMLPANPDLGLIRDLYFDDRVILERKNSLEELSGTFSNRNRFESELLRGQDKCFVLMIEEPQGYEKIITHQYKTQYNEKAFLATLFTFRHRYGIDINFIDKQYSGLFIYYQCYYFLREYLKGN